jgi:hypothetical protein
LYQFIAESKEVPGHDVALSADLMVYAGTPLPDVQVTPTP